MCLRLVPSPRKDHHSSYKPTTSRPPPQRDRDQIGDGGPAHEVPDVLASLSRVFAIRVGIVKEREKATQNGVSEVCC
ncbi:hypothetical protein RSSM_04223 [Rhodopirellula sallentina SM41]|uniref:Uncharacterized protein n=1 Tax=Rhodopirellula sallentina SM41 TaxID=1263870 RepID=M5TZ95_9BACT|nr:hypothetical protein RSSM_04223 [Rhodopirellula sallentina SM41]